MISHEKLLQILGGIFFTIGILVGFFLLILTVWGDLEASLFASSLDAEKSLGTLRCPIIISSKEIGEIKATFKNPLEKDWERYTRAYITEGYITLKREIKQPIPIPANQKRTVSWEIYPKDAVYDRFILFHLYVNARYPYPSLDGSCGVILLDLWGLSGSQIIGLILGLSLTCILLGFLLINRFKRRSSEKTWNRITSMYSLAIIIYLGLVIGYFGAWVIALLLLISAVLMSGIIIGRIISTPN